MASLRKAYNQFLNTEEGGVVYNAFKDVLYSPSDSLAQKISHELIRHLLPDQKDKTSICDIGGGDGKRMAYILSYLTRQYPDLKFKLDFIEQSEYFCCEFEERRKKEIPGVEVTIYHGFFENVVDTLAQGSYDIVFLIHSIFAFQDDDIVSKISSLVKPEDGKIVFISNAQNSLLAKLKQVLDQGYADKRIEIDDIKAALSARNIAYSSFTLDTNFSISQKDIETSFNKILNWLSLGRFQDASGARVMKDLLLSLGKTEGGVHYFTEQEEVLIIPPVPTPPITREEAG